MVISSRQKESLLWFICVGFTVALLLLIARPFEKTPEAQGREPASVEPPPKQSKAEILKGSSGFEAHRHGKGSSYVMVEIAAIGKHADSRDGRPFELKATIEAQTNVAGLQYAWILPAGVTIASGAERGALDDLGEGERTTASITLQSNGSENHQIHFHVYKNVDGEERGMIAQYNTVDQEAIDQTLQAKAAELNAFWSGKEHLSEAHLQTDSDSHPHPLMQ